MEKAGISGDRLTAFNTRLDGLVETGQWAEAAALFTDPDFLGLRVNEVDLKYNAHAIGDFLRGFLELVPEEVMRDNVRLSHIQSNLGDFSESLVLVYNRGAGVLDPNAVCNDCGEVAIVHGDVDLGITSDEYNNYFSLCTHCLWSWHEEQVSRVGTSDRPLSFDYQTNTYVAYS